MKLKSTLNRVNSSFNLKSEILCFETNKQLLVVYDQHFAFSSILPFRFLAS